MDSTPAPQLIERLHRALEPAPPGLVSVYLFGSHAEGRAHRESDVDIGVVLDRRVFPTARERFDERVRLAGVLGAGPTRPADVVVLNDVPPELGRRIVTKGLRVACADPEGDHTYVRDVLLRAADVAPFLRRARLVKLSALAR
jgi:predicted nucleotidyltransferase